MMKLKSIILSGMALLLATSCTDLTETYYSVVGADDYGKTPSEIQTIVGRAYTSLRGGSDNSTGGTHYYPTCEYAFFATSLASDECALPVRVGGDWDDGGQYLELQRHTWKSSNKTIWSLWKYAYNGVSNVNSVIYQVEKSTLKDADKDNIKAELRALRAYYYYRLLDEFGDVPIVKSFEETVLPAKSTRAEVYAFVESELKDVISKLPITGYGRMTQNAGNCLLARLYLNSGVYIGQEKWQQCIDVCDKISGQLEPDYFTSFKTQNQTSKEILFAIPYDHKEGTVGNYLASMSYHYEQKYAFSATGSYPWCGNGICAKPGLYSAYDSTDVRRKSFLIGEQINIATGSVIIMPASGNPLNYTEDISTITNAKQNEGARLMKYQVNGDDAWERDNDWVLMRYAEVLMMKAECYMRLGSPELARPFVEQVRNRVGLKTPATIDLDFINKELRMEFVFEDHRRTDNIRFGDFFKPWWQKGVSESFKAVYPIPSYEIAKNNNLVQNPNYTN